MNQILLFIGLVIILCLTIKPVGKKLPFPTLLIFIALGMLLGVNGPAHIDFSDYALTETVCSTALLFIMFYGGFNTNIDRAKPVAAPAVLLSTLGVIATAGITGVFAHFALGFDWIGGLLLGSVVASTDAASVFSVLREHNLSLKGGTDSLLEVESGSNDPVAYMLTAVLATLAAGGNIDIPVLLAKQIILGVGLGLAIGWISSRLIERAHATAEGAQTIFLFAVAIVAYALPSYLGGNGFLAVYLAGIVLGASDITGKVEMAHFFDTLTEMAEMTIFFLLGLLVTPARLPQMLLPGLALMAFMLFASRPIAVGLLLGFATLAEQIFVLENAHPNASLVALIGYMKVFSKGMFTFLSILIGYNAQKAFGGSGVNGAMPATADPYLADYYDRVTDKWILEVRRERGIELCLEMGLRWDDDMRWHMGDLLTSDNNPWTGIYIGSTNYTYDYTGLSTDDNGDPVPDFYIRPGEDTEHSIAISNTGANQTFSLNGEGNIVWEYRRVWSEKKYLRPIPLTAITRNPNLEQNALWK